MGAEADPLRCLLLKLRARDLVSEDEEAVLREAAEDVVEFGAGKTIIRAGLPLSHSTLVADGIVARTKDLSGGERQIQDLHLAGDFTDLHGFLLKRLDHDIVALTRTRIVPVPHERLRAITERQPHLARLLWLMTLVDASIQREKILTIGRRPAIARVAHLMCELAVRFGLVGLADEAGFALPITQLDIADATGLTSVHVNRMLRQLRDDGLMTFRGGRVEIHDRDGLQRVAEFDAGYLYLERRPR
ncbi:MAG: Crp/Fnr family transcriptional regulator [Pseudomonadota bacterium]|nr:Crp/Fnr family transcriptional regulator [Pseudomonadota bacterium]